MTASKAIALSSGSSLGKGSRGNVQKAQLRVYEARRPSKGGVAAAGKELPPLKFQFNPKELTIQKAARWERKQAAGSKKAGPPEFTGSDACKLSLELFFDASDTHDARVVTRVEALFACCVPTGTAAQAWPPLVALQWGSVTSFLGFVTSVQAKYVLFAADGTPIRATCSVTIEEMPETLPPQNPSSGTLAPHSEHTMVAGDTLASIAYAEYGDPGAWRRLAAYNGIDDPLRLRVGCTLKVPTAEALTGLGG